MQERDVFVLFAFNIGFMKRIAGFIFICFITLSFTHCNKGPYATTNKSYKKQAEAYAKELMRNPGNQTMATASSWVGTTNFNMRKPNIVVIHHTAQNSCEQTLKTFTLPRTQVSAHYVICKDGTVHHMLNDYLRAWHGGAGKWGNINDVNSSSIGIEIDNDGFQPFSEEQLGSLMTLLDTLKRKYSIPAANFIGHADIAPTRKNDPNVHFPWKRFADRGFGLWWSDTSNMQIPLYFNNVDALKIIGYDVKDTSATIQAFRRKFLAQEGAKTLSESDRKVLYSLYKQALK
ncbi:MAG: N-acetylmuramoyl-L-alanine amidase [Flaviaesturariibacter sp.]|nr:N-acetylmuramoyl-L-alanine amidase [Flaviaesturariibacter sp.]